MNVLSLFDGISCGRVALGRAGFSVNNYIAYEIDKYAKIVSNKNYPAIEQCGDVFSGNYSKYKGFDLLMGGSPCTHWSIARNNRETTIDGMGGQLFSQYTRALEESGSRYFIYENNYSIHQDIKDAISAKLGVTPIMINSALVSAQTRKRCYWTNIPVKGLPLDKGILLKDILESGIIDKEKAYCLKHQQGNSRDYFKKRHTQIAFEPMEDVGIVRLPHGFNKGSVKSDGKAPTVTANGKWQDNNKLIEPLRIGTIEHSAKEIHDSKQYRVYSPEGKSTTLCGQGGGMGAKTGLYACQIHNVCEYSTAIPPFAAARIPEIVEKYGFLPEMFNVYNKAQIENKAPAQTSQGSLTRSNSVIILTKLQEELAEICGKKIYVVADGLITINGIQYPVKLTNGLYIIRKLTPVECERLQTLPDNYTAGISDTQRYKAIGNGWTVDVIAFILSFLSGGSTL